MLHSRIKVLSQIEGFLSTLQEIPESERAPAIELFCQKNPHVADDLHTILKLIQENPSDWEPPITWPESWVDPALPPGTRVGAYSVQNCLGMGSMGIVYRAVRSDGSYEQDVAIKVLAPAVGDADLKIRFQQERHLLASLNHSGIAHILDAGFLASGEPYFVMELVIGMPITQYCDRHRLTLHQRAELFQQVVAALSHAHQRRVIHSDLKPAHFLVTKEGQVKIIDFGIARSEKNLQDCIALGFTPAYASPEQIRGEPITTLSDTYSACAILFELLVGDSAFDFSGCDLTQALERVKNESPRSLIEVFKTMSVQQQNELAAQRSVDLKSLSRQFSNELQAIFSKGLSKQADQRYGSIQYLASDVSAYLNQRPLSCMPQKRSYLIRKFIHRHPFSVRMGSLLFCVLLLLTLLWLGQIRKTYYQRQQAEKNLQFLLTIFDHADLKQGGMAGESALNLINRSALSLKNSQLSAGDKSRMLDLLSRIYRQMGQPNPGTLIAEEALNLKTELGAAERDLAVNYSDLGQLHLMAGNWTLGMDFLNKALAIQQNNKRAGKALLQTWQSLGFGYQLNGDLNRAEACYREILSAETVEPQVQILKEQASLNLSWLYMEENEMERVKPLLQTTLRQRKARYGSLHPATLRTREAWTHFLYLNGSVKEAFHEIKLLLDDTQQAYKDFPDLAQPPLLFASELALAMGQNALAQTWLDHGWGQNPGAGNTPYFDIIPILNQQALISASQGDFSTALGKIKQAFSQAEEPGIPARFRNQCFRTRAEIYQRQGDFQNAERDYSRLFANRENEGWSTNEWLRADNEFGWFLVRTGRGQDAVTLYEKNLRDYPKMLPLRRLNCLHNLGWAYVQVGRRSDGIESFRNALSGKIEMFGADHPSVALSQHSLAWCLFEDGKLDEALELNQQALTARAKILGKSHPDYAWSLNNHAIFLYQKGELEKALSCIEEAYSIRKQIFGPENPATLQSMASWVRLLAKNGKIEQAYRLGCQLYALYEKRADPQRLLLAESLLKWSNALLDPQRFEWQKRLNQLKQNEQK